MYHSITIGVKNSWDDWHLVPSSRLIFNPPNVKTKYVDIPGANGSLDFTDTLTGAPVYEDREGTLEFIVVNGYGSWAERFSEIMNYLHGKKFNAVLEDDPGYYYSGRFSVNSWGSEESWSTISINYKVSPYKISLSTGVRSL